MIKKEWRKLEKQLIEENEKNNKKEEPKEDNNDKKEIIIVDINNNIEEEKDKKDKNENNNNNSKYKTKPGPILKVDTTSLNMTEYQVNNDQRDYGIPQYNNYYRGYDSSLNYIPRNYNNKYTRNSYFNTQNNIYNNNHINNLAKSNDYTYTISTRYNSLLNKDNNNNYKNIDTPYRLNRNNSYLGKNYTSTGSNKIYLNNKPLVYNYNLQEKPHYLRSMSYKRYTDIDKKDDNSKRNENNNYLFNSQRINSSLYNTSKNSLNPNEKRITYCLNISNSIDDIIMRYNNRNRNYKGFSPYKLNYNYI